MKPLYKVFVFVFLPLQCTKLRHFLFLLIPFLSLPLFFFSLSPSISLPHYLSHSLSRCISVSHSLCISLSLTFSLSLYLFASQMKKTTCLFTLRLWLYDNFLSGINGSNGWRPPNDGGGGVDTFAGVTIGAFDTGDDTFVAAELIDKLILLLKFSFVERFKMSVWLFLLQSWLAVLVMLYVSWTMTGLVEGLSDIIEDLIMSGS